MDDARRNEIAFRYLIHEMVRKGATISPNLLNKIDENSLAIGITFEEGKEFAKIIIGKTVEEILNKPSLRLV